MNHKPRQPRQGPSQNGPQNTRGRPGAPHPQVNNGYPPAPGQPGFAPPPRPGGMPPPLGQGPNGAHHNHINGYNGRGAPPPGRRMPPPNQAPAIRAEDIAPPFRPQKPIPASVPSVDPDAIASALNQCASELDALERNGRHMPPRPEAIDDLVVVDMYTPKEKIPTSKRHIAAQVIARQGPAEEGEGLRQNDLINALRSGPAPTRAEPHGPGSHDQIQAHANAVIQDLPEPRLFTPKEQQVAKSKPVAGGVSENMLDAFEAAVFGDEPAAEDTGSRDKEIKQPPVEREKGDLSQGEFANKLMPENNAYSIERETDNPVNYDGEIGVEELHALYAAQKADSSNKAADNNDFLFDNKPAAPSGGFLSGLGGSDNAQSTARSMPEPVAGQGLTTSGGFLSGLDNSGTDQTDGFASRRPAFDQLPDNSASTATQSGGVSGFLQGLGTGNNVSNNAPLPVSNVPSGNPMQNRPVAPGGSIMSPEPGYGAVWQSENMSPEAKAYRNESLFAGAQQTPAQQEMPPHPAFMPGNNGLPPNPAMGGMSPMGQPRHVNSPPQPQVAPGGPSFLSKPSLSKQAPETQAPEEPKKPTRPKQRANSDVSKEEKRRRRAIRAYFGNRPLWSLFTASAGLVMMASQYRYDPIREWVRPEMTPYLVAGGVIFLLSILWRYLSVRKPKEEALDDWIAEDLINLEKHALESMQLNNRYLLLEPVVMSGFPDLDSLDDEFVNGLYGKDHILRYTPRALTVICFTRDELITYEGAVDITNGEIAYENTREFFYADIATIGLVKEKVRNKFRFGTLIRPWRWGIVERILRMLSGRPVDKMASKTKETFVINLKDGTRIQVILRDGRVLRDRAFEEIPLSTDDKVLDAIKEFVVAQKTDQLAGIGRNYG